MVDSSRERFDAELQVRARANGDLPEQPEIPHRHPRSSKRVEAGVAEAHLGDRRIPPSISTRSLIWSAICVLPGEFSDVPDAVTLNGVPL